MTGPTERRQGRRSAEQARATRARIVTAAGDLFTERGYIHTSIRDIGRHAGVTTGAVYGHFRSKSELLAEAINTRTAEQLEADTMGLPVASDYIETLTRQARRANARRSLRALIVQGAAAAQTDDETRTRLREEQLAHIELWIEGYERNRDRMGIHPSVDLEAAVLYTWAVELGLGVLESLGIEPKSARRWAEVQNRLARSLQLPPDDQTRARPKARRRPSAP